MSAIAPSVLPERLPEVGELVQVRSRRWIVEEVAESQAPGELARQRALRTGGGRCCWHRRMTSEAALASDPVFQLNVLLWALEDFPDITAVRPVLRRLT